MMSRVGMLIAALISVTCAGCDTTCDAADEKATDCGVAWGGEEREECSGQTECFATCFDDLSCKDIVAEDTGQGTDYARCLAACPADE
jgi:hypothetical protein